MTYRIPITLAMLTLLISGCDSPSDRAAAPTVDDRSAAVDAADSPPAPVSDTEMESSAPLIPPEPGEEGGLPDDRTPLSEGPIAPDSAQGAGQVVQLYGALLGEGRFADAYALWGDGGRASGMTATEFAASFERYSELHALVGAPSETEGAAGSIYVTVPMQLYGRLRDGSTVNMIGPVTLRRINDVPGSTDEQRRWHISDIALVRRGTVREGE